MQRTAPILLLLILTLAGLAPLAAQGGSNTDIITGTVTGPSGAPVPGAQVAATSLETGVRRTAQTNAQGRYTIAFPGGGGQYRLEISAPGLSPQVRQLARMADEEVLVANTRLETTVVAIEGVQVTGQRNTGARFPGGDPGATERMLPGEALQRLPIDASDLTAIASLTPGVVTTQGDSLAGFSVLGQGPSGNQISLDGVSFGGNEGFGGGMGSGVPAEAVRATRVVTNTYDVSRGQFSGGQIATTTRSGTNQLQGSFTYALRDPALQWTEESSPFAGSFRLNRVSGGAGGPILRNKLFYFGGFSMQRRSEGVPSLLSADALSLQRLGVSPDSVSQLLLLLSSRGIFDPAGGFVDDRVGSQASLIGRLDYNLTDAHTLTLRADGQWFSQDAIRVGPLDLPQNGGSTSNSGGGLMATLTSRFGNGWINELRAYGSRNERDTEPYAVLPSGRVRVSSELEDGSVGISTLGFGGGAVATQARSGNWEVTDELSLLIGTTHRVRLGGTITSTSSRQSTGGNLYGSYTFNSLADLAANRPTSFSRTLAMRERESGGINSALYLGDTWRASQRLQLTYGARLETSSVGDTPEHNPEVERLFGRRTDRIPSEIAVTPRAGFSYTLGPQRNGPPAGVLRGGVGVFRASPSWNLYSAARDLTGLPSSQSQLVCVGPSVPTPDWDSFLRDPQSIPTSCLGGGGGTAPSSGRGNSVAVFDQDFRTSQSWRASLGVQRRLIGLLGISLDATYAEGMYQQGVRDLNLQTTPRFTLPQEGGRPVFAPEQAIVPATGEVGYFASRLHRQFGQVMEVNSDLKSRTTQLTAGLNGAVPQWRLFFQGNYTLTRSRDQGSAGGGFGRGGFGGGFIGGGFGGVGSLPLTAGNPNEPEWATSDFERRHSFNLNLGRSFASWIDASLIGRATSGSPFTPIVGGDINGDGARNDRAFIFDPATAPDAATATAIGRLLQNAPEQAQECLRSQLGQIAARNSCTSPWSYSLDLRLNLRPQIPSLGRRLSLSVDFANTLAGIDRLVHGAENLHGWGQFQRPDPTLLYPRGFDAATRSYRYEVNERFGSSRSGSLAIRNPFQLQIQGQLQVGRGRGQGGGFMGMGGFGGGPGMIRMGGPGGRDGGGGGFAIQVGPGGGPDVGTLLARAFPNPIVAIVALADSLRLTPEQLSSLKQLEKEVQQKQDSLSTGLEAQVGTGPGGQRDMGELFRAMQPRLAQSRENAQQALAAAEKILTPEQWSKLPESVRNPPRGPGGGQRRNQP